MRKTAVLVMLVCLAIPALAQEPKTFRQLFGEAQKAAEEKKAAEYLERMLEAMKLEHDRTGRPFYQFHLARAYALNGKTAESMATLEAMWNERVEGPMMYFADLDPAFESVRKEKGYARIRALFDTLAIEVAPAGGSVYEITGAGCTLAASIGPDGVFLVDSGYPRTTLSLLRALKKQAGGEPRVRYIVNTHGHFDHAASNHDAGPDAIVIAHPAAVEELKNGSDFVPGFRIPPVVAGSLPDVMTDRQLTVAFNGETVRVVALPAHTAGDLVVWFEGSRVLHMGDDYFGAETTVLYPGPDPATFLVTLGPLLESIPDDAVVISGHAPRVPASQLKAAFHASKSIFTFVSEAIAAGKTNEAIVAEAEAKGHVKRWVEFYLRRLRPKA